MRFRKGHIAVTLENLRHVPSYNWHGTIQQIIEKGNLSATEYM